MTCLLRVEEVDDWVECFDPKTGRKYYFSRSRKKSAWTKPEGPITSRLVQQQPEIKVASKLIRSDSPSTLRRPSPTANTSTAARAGGGGGGVQNASPARSPSPASSARVSSSSSSSSGRSASSHGTATAAGASASGGRWEKAKDPKSGRDYWFNR